MLENIFGFRNLFGRITVDRQQHTAGGDVSGVALGFVLRNSHPDEGADQASHRTARSEPGKASHDGAGRNERAYAGNGKHADSGQDTKRSTDYAARSDAG